MKTIGYYYAADAAEGGFSLLDAPLQHLTHLIISFADIDQVGRMVWPPAVDCRAVKDRFPGLKVLLAVGGWTWSGRFSDTALTLQSRSAFAESALALMERFDFDGLDVDWEYPVTGGLAENVRRPEDRENFTLFLETLRRTFDVAEIGLGRHLLLTSAQSASKGPIEALETAVFHRFVDWIHLMTYDFHGSWHPQTGHNSDLVGTESAVRLHLDRGFPAEKIVVGTPLYAHQWVKTDGAWQAGPVLLWNEAQALRTPENFRYDPALGASWLEEPGRFVTWDSAEALDAKRELVRRLGLGGLMTWQITGDPEGFQLSRMADRD